MKRIINEIKSLNAIEIEGFAYIDPSTRTITKKEFENPVFNSNRIINKNWRIKESKRKNTKYIKIIFGNVLSKNWSEQEWWADALGINLGIESGRHFAPTYIPLDILDGLRDGDTIKLVSPNGMFVFNMTINQNESRYYSGSFKERLHE